MKSKDIYDQVQGIFSIDKDPYNKYGVDWILVDESLEKIFYIGGQAIALVQTVIAILFTLMVVFEIAYLTIPIFRENLEQASSSKEKLNKACGIAFRDARKAYEVQSTQKTWQQPLMLYVKLKLKQFVTVAIQLWVANNIDLFVNIVLNLVGPLLDTIKAIMH